MHFSLMSVFSRSTTFMINKKCQRGFVTVQEINGAREITMDHEKTRNSLSLDMINNLIEAINKDKDNKSLRAIVIGAKGKVFSAGHNLKEFTASTGSSRHKEVFDKAAELMFSIVRSPVPVIAKVNGITAAAGCQLVAQCDLVVCTDVSKFSTPGANVGIFCSTPGIPVARTMPKSKAMYMLLTGDQITAQEAYEFGLVSKVVSAENLHQEVDKILEKIRTKSRSVIELGKKFYYQQIELGLSDAYKLGGEIMVKNINTVDGQEGINSFVEKRKPTWSHFG